MLNIDLGQLPTEKVKLTCYDIRPSADGDSLELSPNGQSIEFDPLSLNDDEKRRFREYIPQPKVLLAVMVLIDHEFLHQNSVAGGTYPYNAIFEGKTYSISRIQDSLQVPGHTFVAAGASVVR